MDTSRFRDKASKREDLVALYDEFSYIEAYARHTAMRIEEKGHEHAVGSMGDWDSLGFEQLDFLKEQGLEPRCSFLDLGCGTGRLARRIVPYLDRCRYVGLEICEESIGWARRIGDREGWTERGPRFVLGDGTLSAVKRERFCFVWAHSVVNHLPPDIVVAVFRDLSEMDFDRFLFTFKASAEVERTGLKQFSYPALWLEEKLARMGLHSSLLEKRWPGGHRTMEAWR